MALCCLAEAPEEIWRGFGWRQRRPPPWLGRMDGPGTPQLSVRVPLPLSCVHLGQAVVSCLQADLGWPAGKLPARVDVLQTQRRGSHPLW